MDHLQCFLNLHESMSQWQKLVIKLLIMLNKIWFIPEYFCEMDELAKNLINFLDRNEINYSSKIEKSTIKI